MPEFRWGTQVRNPARSRQICENCNQPEEGGGSEGGEKGQGGSLYDCAEFEGFFQELINTK